MNFHVWNKISDKFHGWCLFHPEYLRNFIHWRFMNDNSWTLIHKIWILCSTVMSSSLYLLPNSILPNGPGYYLAILQNPLCQITEWTLLNCQVHVAKSAFSRFGYTSTRQYCKIVKFKFTLWTAQMSHHIKKFWDVLCLRSTEISAQKNKLPWSPFPLLPPRPPVFFLHYYFLTWWVFEAWEESFQNSNYPLN